MGTWGTDADLETTNALSGSYSLKLNQGQSIETDYFPAQAGTVYRVFTTVKRKTGTPAAATLTVDIYWYQSDKSANGNSTPISQTVATTWYEYFGIVTAPASTRWAKIRISYTSDAGQFIYIDNTDCMPAAPAFRCDLDDSANQTAIANGDIIEYEDEQYDFYSWWDTTDHDMTIPITAYYNIYAKAEVSSASTLNWAQIALYYNNGGSWEITAKGTAVAPISGADNVIVTFDWGVRLLGLGEQYRFHLLCNSSSGSDMIIHYNEGGGLIADEINSYCGARLINLIK